MHYINVQSLDHDDYPMGTPTKIGPFADKDEAEDFLTKSSRFECRMQFYDYKNWQMVGVVGRHSVSILSQDSGLQDPSQWA